ncbi:recombinase family protein [Deefgea salmonis]|uniref:Recombinase family protein n=1 Tax=Deefgea salmonis TaxID=2875502 RepID=A0ABS8BLQ3_9NEIS|nr:recombinase family protein [Deefgea salmonis]MCB5196446.1 recombinase family protein [Deefgea salmonis]
MILAYTRVSTSEQTTIAQESTITDKYKIDQLFTDAATSGSKPFSEREGAASLLAYVKTLGSPVTLVVAAIDRLGRNTVDVITTIEELQSLGVTVVSVREGFDLSTPIGKAMLTMLAAVAELERENIRSRQRAGIEAAKAAGRYVKSGAGKDSQESIQAARAAGMTQKEAAASLGLSLSSIKRYWSY